MASISSSSFLSFMSSSNIVSSTYSFSPFSHRPSTTTKPKRHHVSKITCKSMHSQPENPRSTSQEEHVAHDIVANRRNVVLGLGGLCGAAVSPFAFAAPVPPPDLTTCGPGELPPDAKPTNCCPPVSTIIDFKFPSSTQPPRVRRPAHLVTNDYVAQYERATMLMKDLPPDDPRNFFQQANVHCAYCVGAYNPVGYPEVKLKVHYSWLFFPFHRWYLYFYERILSSLIKDPTFCLPFWNWDTPAGMEIPAIFTNPTSSLYDALRNANHQPPTIIDFNFEKDSSSSGSGSGSGSDFICENLTTMYKQMIRNATKPSQFFGRAYCAGTIEQQPHNTVHDWTGDPIHRGEDMGILYSAARDPIFFAHHSNVDRMWNIWKTLGRGRGDITDPDWLDSEFLFYDENKNLVRVKVRDCVDTERLGYVYQEVDIPWRDFKPTSRRRLKVRALETLKARKAIKFPVVLENKVSTVVERPKKGRTKKEKEEEEEVLVIEGIEFERDDSVKFDVFINGDDEKVIRADATQFAGSFVSLPHTRELKDMKMSTSLTLGLTDLLEELGADNDDNVVVTLVPSYGKGPITIRGIKIEFIAD